MSEIIVKSQLDYDNIPDDFKGYVYIQANSKIMISKTKGSVIARENSSVEARENSSVEAWGNSSVVARGNTQVLERSSHSDIKILGNARIVKMPKTIQEFCDFYGIKVEDNNGIFYKAVRQDLSSWHDNSFKYDIGKTFNHKCDLDITETCSTGLHIAHKDWALQFGNGNIRNFKVLECSVPLDKIVVPENTDGKVRTSELTVLREVPLEELGLYGKMIAKSMNKV